MSRSRSLVALLAAALVFVTLGGVSQRVYAELSVPAPLAPMPMPFLRSGDPSIIPATVTPASYLIQQPAGSVTYRAYNPCTTADVRIKTVRLLEPLVTQDTKYPGVKLITSRTEVIDQYRGTRYGRGSETMGSTANPTPGSDRAVSIMLVPVPDYPGDISGLTCEYELQYGRSG